MITGVVRDQHALVSLSVRGPQGKTENVTFTVDTGYTGTATLPLDDCLALALPVSRTQFAILADGSQVSLDVYEVTLLWDGEERGMEILAINSPPLLGMTALEGYDVRLQVAENGLLTIEASPL